MVSSCLPKQQGAIADAAQLKAFFGTRRAGKSWTIGIDLFLDALAYPGSSCLYLGLTKDTARDIMLRHILEPISDRFGIGAKWRENDRVLRLPNGSYIYVRGADANQYEIRKVVGQKYRRAVLDEASKYRHNVREMVYDALLPAMGDDVGTVILSGTPSNVTTGLFYDVTTGAEPGWSVHRMSWKDNVFKRDNLQKTHDALIAANPDIIKTPGYQQEWLGMWVVDSEARVYRFREDVNTCSELPRPEREYTFLLGGDLGYRDATALVIVAFHPHDPVLYVVYAEKRRGLDYTAVAQWIRSLWQAPTEGGIGRYPFAAMVFDAAALQGVEELRNRWHLPIAAAEKQGKQGVIEAMNAEIITGRVKLLPAAQCLADEYNALVWDDKELRKLPKRWVEDPRLDNHAADAGLYIWRKARNYDATDAPPPAPDPRSQAALDQELERLLQHGQRSPQVGIDGLPEWVDRRMA